ncbi:hypothetical protein MTES_1665 [Microbacterium testaceum StLB037]|uniref:Uncharacterized protein n=1 Tax=Microbacterium testaceum (strain StLB037) TaxID=979556 RepID=E8NAH3_MICTS|nr:hypothetical protein MTES_1665 [Microbacterium testaceum StLB037]
MPSALPAPVTMAMSVESDMGALSRTGDGGATLVNALHYIGAGRRHGAFTVDSAPEAMTRRDE